jgi:hypothetical protein
MSIPACLNHPEVEAAAPCSYCRRPFCSGCLVELVGRLLCAECKETALREILATQRRHPQALPALIVPIVGLLTCVFLPVTSSVGLWLGWRALREIQADPRYSGRTLALAGLVVSGATLADWVIALIATLIFRFSG